MESCRPTVMESRPTNNIPTGGSVVESADWVITSADSITDSITDSRKLLCWYGPLRLASVTYYYQMYLLPQIPQGYRYVIGREFPQTATSKCAEVCAWNLEMDEFQIHLQLLKKYP